MNFTVHLVKIVRTEYNYPEASAFVLTDVSTHILLYFGSIVFQHTAGSEYNPCH